MPSQPKHFAAAFPTKRHVCTGSQNTVLGPLATVVSKHTCCSCFVSICIAYGEEVRFAALPTEYEYKVKQVACLGFHICVCRLC